MSDPSTTVLSLCFVVVAAQVLIFGWLKSKKQQLSSPPPLPNGKVAVWFYQKPDTIGIIIIFCVFAGIFGLSQGDTDKVKDSLMAISIFISILFQFLLTGMVAAFALQRTSVNSWLGLRWPNWPMVFLIAPVAIFTMMGVFWVIDLSGYFQWIQSLGVETVQDTVKLLQESNDPWVLGSLAIAAVIVAPICEEIIFRGYFYPVLKRFAGMWPAAFASALFFSAIHNELGVLLPLFILGGVLIWVYEKTGSIWAPIAVHFCFNATTVGLQFIARIYDIPLVNSQ